MFQQILAIIRNTFFESVRQPVVLVVLVGASLLIVLSNPLSAFTMDENQRMLIDIGLATIFMSAALLSGFIATSVLGREISNKTALTVISKPVGRPLFVLGKFVGVALAMMLSTLFLFMIFMLVETHAVLETVQDPIHLPVVIFGSTAFLLGWGVAAWCNYFYNMVFTSSVIFFTTPLLLLAWVLSINFGPDFSSRPMGLGLKPDLWLAIVAMMMAILMMCAIAVAVSTRAGQLMTILVTVGLFLLGLLSDSIFLSRIKDMEALWLAKAKEQGLTLQEEASKTINFISGESGEYTEIIDVPTVPLMDLATTQEKITYWLYVAGYDVLPNFQVMWLTDAITQNHTIPASYVVEAILYGLAYSLSAIAVGVILFQRREVG
ncbi:MAG: hypothetical protein CMJ40_01190 [Phycisphaerae bacterium]|nr:hypothetical protein [Phycisphaerae bacterium]|tara:strand:- start:347 stop:1480 length:1134 start_codon:yes stop_codon:yes gene_type:complete